jgi:DNA-binding response OmpR family regulator
MTNQTSIKTRKGNLVLIIHADRDFIKQLKTKLGGNEQEIATATDGEEGLKKFSIHFPKLIILDSALPKLSGFEVCRQIRNGQAITRPAIITLTAGAEEAEIALGLGADDYVNKPVSLSELNVRIRRLLRAGQPAFVQAEAAEIAVDDLHLDIPRHRATVEGRPVHLTLTEFKLLRLLTQRRGFVQTRERLLQEVWHYNSLFNTRTVDIHVLRLRRKLGSCGNQVEAVRGVGYRFAEA